MISTTEVFPPSLIWGSGLHQINFTAKPQKEKEGNRMEGEATMASFYYGKP